MFGSTARMIAGSAAGSGAAAAALAGTTRRAFSSTAAAAAVQRLTVVGGGQMGAGIAQVAASTGHDVVLTDSNEKALEGASAGIAKSLGRVAAKAVKSGKMGEDEAKAMADDAIGRITYEPSLAASVADADLVVEAIVENLDIKQAVFAEIDENAPAHTMLASNTSSLAIGDIFGDTRSGQVLGLHFFNPVPVMQLLEVVKGPTTSDETFEAGLDFGRRMGKQVVRCVDSPGFVVNRLLVPLMFEALRMAERGDATLEDIDTAMKFGAGHPMGPFVLADYVGLDTLKFIMDGWHAKYPEETLFKPSKMLDDLVADGAFGVKAGRGFYDYSK